LKLSDLEKEGSQNQSLLLVDKSSFSSSGRVMDKSKMKRVKYYEEKNGTLKTTGLLILMRKKKTKYRYVAAMRHPPLSLSKVFARISRKGRVAM